jgi:hypothetical protein
MHMPRLYGPLYPPAYAIASIVLFLSLWATRFGIAHFFKVPPKFGTELLDGISKQLMWILLLSIGLRSIAQDANQSGGIWNDLILRAPGTFVQLVCWCVLKGVKWEKYFECLAVHDELGEGSK